MASLLRVAATRAPSLSARAPALNLARGFKTKATERAKKAAAASAEDKATVAATARPLQVGNLLASRRGRRKQTAAPGGSTVRRTRARRCTSTTASALTSRSSSKCGMQPRGVARGAAGGGARGRLHSHTHRATGLHGDRADCRLSGQVHAHGGGDRQQLAAEVRKNCLLSQVYYTSLL